MAERPTAEEREAHAAWIARGKTGEGRLTLTHEKITKRLEGADLRGADFEMCDFEAVSLDNAQLDGARFRACSFSRTDLRRASAVDARFEDCDFRKASIAGLVVGPTGFLRCKFGDFASQPIGKPDVRAAYLVLSPDLSAKGDGSRIGSAPDVDDRWHMPSREGRRRFVLRSTDGARLVITVLDMHVRYALDAGARFAEKSVYQTFAQLLDAGVPGPWNEALSEVENRQLRGLVEGLSHAWTPRATTEAT
jgi:hypothetical protein